MTKILVIEDEEALREEILDILYFEDFEALGGKDGRIGVQLAREHKPDLIICDVTMPEMDGYQTLEALRSDARTALIPFVFLTAHADRSFARHGMELGADDYITKPFSRTELLAAIHARLDRQSTLMAAAGTTAEAAKLKLTRMVAHELRTPLASMSSVVSLISRQLGRLSENELQELLYVHEESNRRLSRLVEQMLLRLQFELGGISRETVVENSIPIVLHKLLTTSLHLARRFAYRNDDVPVEFEGNGGNVELVCDNQLMKHALAELITNALTFSPADGEVTVSLLKHDSHVEVAIVDKGPGIAAGKIPLAMQEFQQIDRDVQEQQGIGLGLALAQKIIQAHDGNLALESLEGKGTRAVVLLPLRS